MRLSTRRFTQSWLARTVIQGHNISRFRRYGVKRLVWFEVHETMEGAIRREKSIKRWHGQWKIQLVAAGNPTWRDLAENFGFESLIKKKVDPGSRPG